MDQPHLHPGLPSPEQGERQQVRAVLQIRDVSGDSCLQVRTQQLCPEQIPTMGLGPALVVSGDEDGLQVASQGIAGLGRTPQVIGGSLGAGGSQKVPPISWGQRPVQKMGQA